jgi:hypothetical protein
MRPGSKTNKAKAAGAFLICSAGGAERPRAWPYTVSAAPVKPFSVSVFSLRHFDFSSSFVDTAGSVSFSFPEKQCQCLMLVFLLRKPVWFPVSPAADGGALCAGREQLKAESGQLKVGN